VTAEQARREFDADIVWLPFDLHPEYPPEGIPRDELRRRYGCDMNLDLNRLARSTSAGSVQGLSGRDARDIPAAVARLLAHSRAERIITCSPADYLAFKMYSGRETRFITECLR